MSEKRETGAHVVASFSRKIDMQGSVSAFVWNRIFQVSTAQKFHHFSLSKENPGMVSCKETVYSQQQSFMLLRDPAVVPPATLPPTVHPDGLSEERRRYLYREIRPFCKPGTEDLVAPQP